MHLLSFDEHIQQVSSSFAQPILRFSLLPSAGFRSFKKLQNSLSRENLRSVFRMKGSSMGKWKKLPPWHAGAAPESACSAEGKMFTLVNLYNGDIGRSTVKFQEVSGVSWDLHPTP